MAKNGNGGASFQNPRQQVCDSVDCAGGDTPKGGMAGGMKPSTPIKSPIPQMGGSVPTHPGIATSKR